jgi:hypothetical protein
MAQKETGNGTPGGRERTTPEPYNALRPVKDLSYGDARGDGIYSEDFESFTPGALVPQGGWDSDWAPNAAIITNGIGGTQSAQHTSDGTAADGFEMRSPIFVRDFHTFRQEVVVTGGGSTYHVIPQDSVGSFFITRIAFETDGDITFARVNATMDAFEFLDTGFNWSPGVPVTVQVNTYDNGTMEIFINTVSVYTGPETNFLLNGTPGQTDSYLYWAANEGTGDTLTIDNLTTSIIDIPTLGEWGMMAFILVLMASGVYYIRRSRLA